MPIYGPVLTLGFLDQPVRLRNAGEGQASVQTLVRGLLLVVLAALPGLAGAQVAGVTSDQGRHLLLDLPDDVGGQPVTSVEIDAGAGVTVGHLPDGWAVASTGPPIRLEGPPIEPDRGQVRLDLAEGVEWDGGELFLGPDRVRVALPPPVDYPELEVEGEVGSTIEVPSVASPGELIQMEILDEDLVGIGTWKLEGMEARPIGDSPRLTVRVPNGLRPGQYAAVTYEDAYGLEILRDEEAVEIVGSSGMDEPSLTGCTPMVFAGRTACVCGYFPNEETWGALYLDGQPLGAPRAASSHVVHVQIPEGTTPGPHTITGEGMRGSLEIVVLVARGEIDLDEIQRGGSTPLRVIIEGTDEPLAVRLVNRAPEIIALEGGAEQVVESSGGDRNALERSVTGLRVGAFDVYYELADASCPCEEMVVVAENPPSTRTRDPASDSTRTRPPWWPEEPEGDDPRDVPIPPVYGEEEDEEEDPLCCGFRGPLLVWPQTTDPLSPGEMAAPHAPAMAGLQVLIPSGAYAHQDQDLVQAAVGADMEWLRTYASDVETLSGGLMGHRWDFAYNKRLVPLGRDYAEGLRGQIIGAEQSVVMVFDGQGRALRYVESDSEERDVLNFGVGGFRAYVTTYASPPGEFNELQRYVLTDPSAHPFASHPDVDTENGESIFYVLREKNGTRYVYNCRGQVIHTLLRNDYASLPGGADSRVPVRYTFHYRGARNPLTQNTMLSRIEDPSGTVYTVGTVDIDQGLINTNVNCAHITGTLPIPRIKSIIGGGVEVTYIYEGGNARPVLETVRYDYRDLQTERRYRYTGEHLLEAVISPEEAAGQGRPYIENTYDASGRVTAQTVAGKPRSTLAYTGQTVRETFSTGGSMTYTLARKSGYAVDSMQTISGSGGEWTTRYAHNDDTQVTGITLPRGNRMVFAYDPSNGPVTRGPMRNDASAGLTYNNDLSKGNLLSVRREVGSLSPGSGPSAIGSQSEYEPLYNQPTKVTDERGNETTFAYEYTEQGLLGNAVEVDPPDLTQPDGSVQMTIPSGFEFNARGQIEREGTTEDDLTTYTYDAKGYLTQVQGPEGTVSYTRDLYGRVLTETGPDGVTRYTIDGRGLVTETRRDPYGLDHRATYRYNRDGVMVEERTYMKDDFRQSERLVAGITAPRPSAAYERVRSVTVDRMGRPLRETVSGGGAEYAMSWQYDALGRLTQMQEPSPVQGQLTTTFTYDVRNLTTEEVRAGRSTRMTYDANGSLVRAEEGPAGSARVTRVELDPFDRVVNTITPVGTEMRRTLDASGNMVTLEVHGSTGAEGGATGLLTRTEWTYNEVDLVAVMREDPLGGGEVLVSRTFYTPYAKPARVEDPGGSISRYTYDAAQRLTEVLDPGGNRVRTEYDAQGRTTAIVEVDRELTWNQGSMEWTVGTRESRTAITYDELGRRATLSRPGMEAAYRYDAAGAERLVAIRNGGLVETRYDGLGRPVRVQSADDIETRTYTAAGQLAEVRSRNLHTRFRYDVHGDEVEQTDLLSGATTQIQRDDLGNPVRVTDANGTFVVRTFDAVGMPVTERVGLSTNVVQVGDVRAPITGGTTTVLRRYDGLGRLRYAQTGPQGRRGGFVSFEYDGLGRITREQQGRDDLGQTIERRYAADHSWYETRYPELTGSPVVRHMLDGLGRTIRVDLDNEMVASYVYSGATRVSGRSLRNGAIETYVYDDQRRMTEAQVMSGVSGGRPQVVWTSRATYSDAGRLESVITTNGVRNEVTQTGYSYDARGRVTESVTNTGVVGPTPSNTTSRFLTTYRDGRPLLQAEVLSETTGERASPLFARVQRYEYDGARVAAVTTTARNRFSGTTPSEFTSPQAVLDWIQGDGSFRDRQAFTYDAVGNLVADDANVYSYDYEGRLTRVAQIPANRPYNQAVVYEYGPLGRRIHAYPTRDRVPSGFVDWAPWERDPVWYLYDGPDAIAEVIKDPQETGRQASLLARYVLGARPGERVRMDRRVNEDPNAVFTPYYLHVGMQGQVAFLTTGEGQAVGVNAPSQQRAAGSLAPADDIFLIAGTRTRSPYMGWTLRTDGFAGIKFDEQTGQAVYDYRTSPTLADEMDMAVMRENITAMQNKGAIALGVMTSIALAPGAAAFEGLLNVGFNWFAASWTQSGYTATEAGEHFSEGALSGGLGKLLPGGNSLVSKFAADYVTDVAGGTAFDVGYRGRGWNESLTENLVSGVVSAGLATGMRVGAAGIKSGVGRAMRRYHASRGPSSASATPDPVHVTSLRNRDAQMSGNVFDALVNGKRPVSSKSLHFQLEIWDLLANGRTYHRMVADLIRNGELQVKWDATLSFGDGGTFAAFRWRDPGVIYLNPRAFRQNPMGALEAASAIVHEATHALGGGEIAAHVAQGQFLKWWRYRRGRRRSTPTGSDPPVRYMYRDAFRRVTDSYQALSAHGHHQPLYRMLIDHGYDRNARNFYAPPVGRLHFHVIKSGGMGRLLRLHPSIDVMFRQYASRKGRQIVGVSLLY